MANKRETKADLLRRIEGYEGVQKDLVARAEKCESELKKWKPKAKTFKIQVPDQYFDHMEYSTAKETAKSLLEAGLVFRIEWE